jgi:hypothetical protein
MDGYPVQSGNDPLAMLSLAEVRAVVDLWERKQHPLEVNSAINTSADLATALGISEYEVGAMLSQIRHKAVLVPAKPAEGKFEIPPSWWIVAPIVLFGVIGLFLLSQTSEEEIKPRNAVQKPNQIRKPPPAALIPIGATAVSTVIPMPVEQVYPTLAVSTNARKPSGGIKYLSPDEVNRKCKVYVESFLTD